MPGKLLGLRRQEGIDASHQLRQDSLDLFVAMYPGEVQLLLMQARLYFHVGIWPEKVLGILQHIQTLDPGQHSMVGSLVQHVVEHIEHKEREGVEVKHPDICCSMGLIMKLCDLWLGPHLRDGLEALNGHHQPFYNVLMEDGSCRYAAQENLEYNVEPQETPHPDVGRYVSLHPGRRAGAPLPRGPGVRPRNSAERYSTKQETKVE